LFGFDISDVPFSSSCYSAFVRPDPKAPVGKRQPNIQASISDTTSDGPSPSPQPLLVSRRYPRAGGPLDFARGTDVKDRITVLARHLRERGPALRAAVREEPELDYVHDAGEESEHTEEDEERRPIVCDAVLCVG